MYHINFFEIPSFEDAKLSYFRRNNKSFVFFLEKKLKKKSISYTVFSRNN